MSWWKCAACSGNGAALANGSATTAAAPPSAAAHLLLKGIPSSAMAPLFFFCSACSLRMASCESCHVLVDTERAVGGVLLCRRCGFLTVLDPTLRALLAIPAFNRAFLNRVPFSIADIVELRERVLQCEAQLKSAKQHHNGSDSAEPGPLVPSQQTSSSDSLQHRKRKRMVEGTPSDSQVSPPPSFRLVDTLPSQQLESSSSSQSAQVPSASSSIAALEAQSKVLQRQLHQLVRQWEQFASETTAEQSTPLHHNLQQSFSSTHLNILKVMYDNTTSKLEVAALTHLIEQFLLHQSTLLKMKYDLLAAVETCREIEQLRAPVFQKSESSPSKVTNLIINSTKEQLSHRYRAFQTLARPYLSLIGAANKHLFALYSAVQSLQSMRETSEHEREAAMIQRELFGTYSSSSSNNERAGGALSPFLSTDHTRSRRRYGYGSKSSSSNNNGGITSTALALGDHRHHHLMAGGYDDVSRVQQTLEFGNRITEISKKVELWRALSATIASTCVLSVLELSLANDAPLS